jgi:hypothetical protein
MLQAVRRWLARGDSLPAWNEFSAWARANRWTLKRTLVRDGWVMENASAHPGWRIEWGPSQRAFMSSHEFRIRIEVPALADVQALVLDRPLLARLDREVYQQYTGNVQTRLDDETPEEMRWLAMHAKLSPNEMGIPLRDRYGGLANDPTWLKRWLAGPVTESLKGLAGALPVEAVSSEPFILRLSRGRIVIRQAAPLPRVRVLAACVEVGMAAQGPVKIPASS